MADIQSRYSGIPYGWREIDIAAVAARLIFDQKVTVKYAGTTIQPENLKLPDMLRKKSEIGKTSIAKRQAISLQKIRTVKELLREYLDVMDIPADEDGLVAFIIERFTKLKEHYEKLNKKYENKKYPDHSIVIHAEQLMNNILSQQKDNIALIERVISKEDELFDNKEAMHNVESFFKNQVSVFDAAVRLIEDLRNDLDYLSKEEESNEALKQMRIITMASLNAKFDYKRIPELNSLMAKVHEGHDRLLSDKREELVEIVRQCLEAIHTTAQGGYDVKNIITTADSFYTRKKEQISELKSIALLDALLPQMLSNKDDTVEKTERLQKPPVVDPVTPEKKTKESTAVTKKVYKNLNRQIVFPTKTLETEADIDAYVEKMREQLKQLMKNCDGLKLN